MKALILIISTICTLSLACSTSKELETVSIELDWLPPDATHAGIYVAIDQGYFEEENLKVEVAVTNSPAPIPIIVGSKQKDFGIFYQPDTVLARADGHPVVALCAIVQQPLNSLMIAKSSGITRPQELKGKKIGYAGVEFDALMLQAMLNTDGLDLNDIKLVDVGYQLVDSIADGTVDAVTGAWWSYEKFALEDTGHPVNVLYPEDYGIPPFYEVMLITSEDMIQQRTDTVRRFVSAFTRGYEYAIENPQRAIDILVDMNTDYIDESTEAIHRRGIEALAPVWTDSNGNFGTMSKDQWQSVEQYMKMQNLIPQNLNIADAWTNKFCK